MTVAASNVFLVSGQQVLAAEDGGWKLGSEVQQRVVVAATDQDAYQALAALEPGFRPVGHATLSEYEQTVSKLRATLTGGDSHWKLLVAPGMAG